MMNKGFLFLFFVYFFVVQSIIIGVLRSEPKFYLIWMVNFVLIVLIAVFYKYVNMPASWSSSPSEKQEHVYNSYISARRKAWNSFFSPKRSLFLLVLLLAIGTYFLYTYFHGKTQIPEAGKVYTWADLLSNGTWEVLSTSLEENSVENLFVSVPETGEVQTDVTQPEVNYVEPEEDDRLSVPALPTLMDTLIYLMNHYDVSLSSQKNLTFTYVSPKNPYYAQFKTAYDMRLIGKDANPSKNVLCQTYIVMKGLMEERDVVITGDIKSAYRAEAQTKWVLNGCKRNFYVKNVNL